MTTLTLEDINAARETLKSHAVPKPDYLFLSVNTKPFNINNTWLLWLFMNEQHYYE